MKNLHSYHKILFISLALFAVSCNNVLDVNESPNSATKAPVETILNAAFVSHIVAMEGEDARLGAMWAQQFTGADRQYQSYSRYTLNAEAFHWRKHYFGSCEQAEQVIRLAEETSNEFYIGVAKVLQAESYGSIAALYGDAPFSEANQFPEIQNPVFDKQSEIYAGVQVLLDEAIAHFASGNGSDIGGVDMFFGGDASSWSAVASTLKARYYMHTGNYASAITSAQSGIQSNSGDWMAPHSVGYNQGANLYFSFGVYDRAGYMTADGAHLPSILDTANAMYRGNAKTDESERYGDFFDPTAGFYDLNYEGGLFSETSSFPLVTAVENHLILAEAQARTGGATNALSSLNDARAINQSVYTSGVYDSYDAADFDAGGIADAGKGSNDDNLLYEIIEEKYVSLCGQLEVFNDLRRTKNLIGLTPIAGSQFPQRFLIPQVELNSNSNAPGSIPSLFEATEVNK